MCAGLFAFVLILLVMAGFRILSLDSFVSLLSLIAVITPVWYFIMMLRSKKITAIERSRVLAYIPLFIGALIFFGPLRNLDQVSWLVLRKVRRTMILVGYTLIRAGISH